MDDERRAVLLAELAEAQAIEVSARERLHSLGANIAEVRSAHGNPYFYSSRPSDDPKSEANFTGYASHDPAFRLWQEWRQAAQHLAAIQRELST